MLKIGPHLPQLLSSISGVYFFWDSEETAH